MKRSDKDRSGDSSMAEFIIYLNEHEKNLKLVFSSIDKNEDGEYGSFVSEWHMTLSRWV